jgi:hypothetical protein
MKRVVVLACIACSSVAILQAQTMDSTYHALKNWPPNPNQSQHIPNRERFQMNNNMQPQTFMAHRNGMMRRMQPFRPHLTPEQQKQAKTINEDYHKQVAALRSNDKQTLGEFKKQMFQLQQQHTQKLQALLTPEQKEQIAKAKKRTEDNRQVMAAAQLERMKINLSLKDDQVTALKQQREDFRNKVKAIHENNNLLPDQKREQMKALLAQQKEGLKSILTPEQQSKMDSLHKSMNNHRGPWNRGEHQLVK